MKEYTIIVPYERKEDVYKNLPEGKIISDVLQDEETREQFEAKFEVSYSPQEGWDKLHVQFKAAFLDEDWFVNIIEREEDEEEVTYFESKRLGARRGHMLRSMMAENEEEDAEKKRVMEQELKQRLKWKKDVVKKLLKEEEEKE